MSDNKIIRVENLKKYYKGGTIKALDDISIKRILKSYNRRNKDV